MRTAAAWFMAAVTVTVAGCAGNGTEGAESAGDCTSQVRLGGVIYVGYGYTDRQATKFGTAEEADCHDVGMGAPGSVFSDDARQVAVWAFPGYPPDKILGVRFGKDSLEVFLAESMPRRDMDRILYELSQSAR